MRLHTGVLCVAFRAGCSCRWRAWLCARDARGTLRSSCLPPVHSPAPTEQPTSARRRGQGTGRCYRGGPAPAAASRVARRTRDLAGLAPTPSRPGARAALCLCGAALPHHRDGRQQPDMGLPPHHRRTRRTRPPRWSLRCVGNPQTARLRPRPSANERDLDPVPEILGRRCLRLRDR